MWDWIKSACTRSIRFTLRVRARTMSSSHQDGEEKWNTREIPRKVSHPERSSPVPKQDPNR